MKSRVLLSVGAPIAAAAAILGWLAFRAANASDQRPTENLSETELDDLPPLPLGVGGELKTLQQATARLNNLRSSRVALERLKSEAHDTARTAFFQHGIDDVDAMIAETESFIAEHAGN